VEAAQQALCPAYDVFEPQPASEQVYAELFDCFRRLYFGLGKKEPFSADLTGILATLRRLECGEDRSM
jgi:hypothetical protein